MAWLYVAVSAALLVTQVMLARTLPVMLRFLLTAQAIYWALSYVARPAILLAFEPPPRLGDNIADPRLAFPNYAETLPPILSTTCIGLGIYLALWFGIAFFIRRPRGISSAQLTLRATTNSGSFTLIWIIGWIFRLLFLRADTNAIINTFSLLAPAGASSIILFYRRDTNRPFKLLAAPVLLVLAGELTWSFVTATKTPVLAAVIALCIRQLRIGWSRQTTKRLLITAACVVATFSTFQSYKLGQQATNEFNQAATASYPAYMQTTLQIVRRFDLLSAATDSALYPNPSWLSFNEAASRAVKAVIPSVLSGDSQNVGRLWNIDVRSKSYPGAEYSEVSLAEGFIAEGNLLAGIWGVLLEAAFIAAMTLGIANLISRKHPFAFYWGLLLLSYPTLFERGMFGNLEILSKTLQAAIIATLITQAHDSMVARHKSAVGHVPNSRRTHARA